MLRYDQLMLIQKRGGGGGGQAYKAGVDPGVVQVVRVVWSNPLK